MTNYPSSLVSDLLAAAHAAADAARNVTLSHFRSDIKAENKLQGGFDPVTIADRGAEDAIRKVLAELRPDDAVLGEEMAQVAGTSGLTWVIDPIDGTRAYISGAPTWGTLIGVTDADGVIIGMIDQPYIGERFVGGPDGAQCLGPRGTRTLATRQTDRLDQATIFTTFPEVGTKREGAAFADLAGRCKLTRYGMDCYAYALLAHGCVDLVVEAGLNPYDIVGPIGVVQAAGGIVTDWRGGPAHPGGRAVAAANSALHEQALAVLSKVAT